MGAMDSIDVFLLFLIFCFCYAVIGDIDWLSITIGGILAFIYFYPVIRSWFL